MPAKASARSIEHSEMDGDLEGLFAGIARSYKEPRVPAKAPHRPRMPL